MKRKVKLNNEDKCKSTRIDGTSVTHQPWASHQIFTSSYGHWATILHPLWFSTQSILALFISGNPVKTAVIRTLKPAKHEPLPRLSAGSNPFFTLGEIFKSRKKCLNADLLKWLTLQGRSLNPGFQATHYLLSALLREIDSNDGRDRT